jgi:hypothetical protein
VVIAALAGLLAALAAPAGVASPALAAEAKAREQCDPARAEPATIEAIMADRPGYEGRCVAVSAISNGYLLFTSVEGYYRAGPLVGGDPDANPADRERLGLDNWAMMQPVRGGGLHHVTAIGRVEDCGRITGMFKAAAGENDFVWITGFCHYATGPYLWLRGVEVGKPLAATRLVGEAMRAKVGDLVPAPSNWPHLGFVRDHARRYLGALRRNARRTFLKLHVARERPIGSAAEIERLAFGPHRGFAALRRPGAKPQTAIFVTRKDLADATREPGGDDYDSHVCFCTQPDCSNRWPISAIDADNREDRPYVCARFGSYMIGSGRVVPAFTSELGPHGLPEPLSGR